MEDTVVEDDRRDDDENGNENVVPLSFSRSYSAAIFSRTRWRCSAAAPIEWSECMMRGEVISRRVTEALYWK
jgi:hypothetical protein